MITPERFGRFRVRGILGTGATAVVYEGYDASLERTVAIKTLRPELLEGDDAPELLERFRREARIVAGLQHENLVLVYELDEEWNPPFIAMELIRAPSLTKYFREGRRFSIEETMEILRQLLRALAYIHDPAIHGNKVLVHRDVKPGNIFWSPGQRLKLADFGVARVRSSTLTQIGTEVGTPAYMAPEQFRGEPVDGRSDLWSCGVILYELLAGQRLFQGQYETVREAVLRMAERPHSVPLNGALPSAFRAVVEKALSANIAQRFQSAGEFMRALEDAFSKQRADETVVRPLGHQNVPGTEAASLQDNGSRRKDLRTQEKSAAVKRRYWMAGAAAIVIVLAMVAALMPRDPNAADVASVISAFGCANLDYVIAGKQVRVSGFMQSKDDMQSLESQLRAVRGVQQVIAQLQLRPWPYCELLEMLAPYGKHRLPDAAGMRLRVQGYAGALREGQAIVLDLVTPGFPAYVYVDYFQLDGNVVHLVPSFGAPARMLAADSARLVPDAKDPLRLEVRSPFGQEMMVMLATRQPLSASARPEFEPAREYLPLLKQALSAQAPGSIAADYLFIVTTAKAD